MHTFRSFFIVSLLFCSMTEAGVLHHDSYVRSAPRGAAKLGCSLGRGLGNSAEGADGALVHEDKIFSFVRDVTVRDQCGDKLDCALVHLGLTGLDRHAVNVVLAGHNINANVLDGPLLVVGGENNEVWGLVADAALFLNA